MSKKVSKYAIKKIKKDYTRKLAKYIKMFLKKKKKKRDNMV